jgi:hypothetical protein
MITQKILKITQERFGDEEALAAEIKKRVNHHFTISPPIPSIPCRSSHMHHYA